MNPRNIVQFCVAIVIGILIGVTFTHQPVVRAQAGTRVYIEKDQSPGIGSSSIPSSKIVGFSCVIDKSDDGHCFIAYVM